MHLQAHIHSKETFGALDGPGIRYVLFLQGCPLKCLYCHNRDLWEQDGAVLHMTPDEVAEDVLKYKNFIRSGGVTLSGGEPLMQSEFCTELMKKLKIHGIKTAVDTSGIMPLEVSKPALDECDLVLLDIKSIDEDMAIRLTGASNKNALSTLDYLESIAKPVWIRHVVVPGYTLDYDMLERTAQYLQKFRCIQRTDLLPFHKLGEYKWEFYPNSYLLKDTQPPLPDEMEKAREIFTSKGIICK